MDMIVRVTESDIISFLLEFGFSGTKEDPCRDIIGPFATRKENSVGKEFWDLKSGATFEDHRRAFSAMSEYWGPEYEEFSNDLYGHLMQSILKRKITRCLDRYWSCSILLTRSPDRYGEDGLCLTPIISLQLTGDIHVPMLLDYDGESRVSVRHISISNYRRPFDPKRYDLRQLYTGLALPDIVAKVLINPELQPFEFIFDFPEWALSVDTLLSNESCKGRRWVAINDFAGRYDGRFSEPPIMGESDTPF